MNSRDYNLQSGTAGLIWIASILGSAATFATQLLIAKSVGPQLYGILSIKLIIMGFITTISGGAVSVFIMHVYSKDGSAAARWTNGSVHYLGLAQGIGVIFLLVSTWFNNENPTEKAATIALIPYMFGQVTLDLTVTKNQMASEHLKVAAWQFFPPIVRLIVIGLISILTETKEQSMSNISVAFGATGLTMLLAGWKTLTQLSEGTWQYPKNQTIAHNTHYTSNELSFKQALKEILPFGIAGILYLLTIQGNVLVTALLMDSESAGVFNAALAISAALQQMPLIVYQKYLLPKLHLLAHTDISQLSKLHRNGNLILLVLGTTISVILYWLTPELVPFLLGDNYQSSVFALQILSLSVLFRFMTVGASSIILAVDINLKIQLLGKIALANFALLVPLVYFFGIVGAAVATLLSDALALALLNYQLQNLSRN